MNTEEQPIPATQPRALTIPSGAMGKPTDFIRTALFGPATKRPLPLPDSQEWKDSNLQSEQLYARDGMVLKFSGQRLDTYDSDVYTALLKIHAVKRCVVGSCCSTSLYEIGMVMGLASDSAQNLAFIRLRLERLAKAQLSLTVEQTRRKPIRGAFGLISIVQNQASGKVDFSLDVFGMDFLARMTNLELEKYTALASGIPRKMFEIVRSNTGEKLTKCSLEILAKNCAWEGRLDHFESRLRAACDELKALGVLSKWQITKMANSKRKQLQWFQKPYEEE